MPTVLSSADELAEPLVGVPVADDRPGEVGLEELEVRRQHRGAEEQERRVDEPVHDADPVPLEHPGVEERLLEHRDARDRPGSSLRPGAGWPLRITPSMRARPGTSMRHRGDGQGERDDDREHLHEGLLLGRGVLSRSLDRRTRRRQGSHDVRRILPAGNLRRAGGAVSSRSRRSRPRSRGRPRGRSRAWTSPGRAPRSAAATPSRSRCWCSRCARCDSLVSSHPGVSVSTCSRRSSIWVVMAVVASARAVSIVERESWWTTRPRVAHRGPPPRRSASWPARSACSTSLVACSWATYIRFWE